MSGRSLIIFTRYPEPGKVKTRVIPALGQEGAASLQKAMIEHTLRWAKSLSQKMPDLVEVRFEGGSRRLMKEWLGAGLSYVPQGEGDMGERMAQAFQENFQRKKGKVVLVGTDIPQLTAFHVRIAFKALKRHEMVIGPSVDGGYYLIGLKEMVPELFKSISWGTATVYEDTMEKAEKLGLSVKSLEPLQDVDIPEDLPVWEKASSQYLSIIIPTLNEERHLSHTLEHIGPIPQSEVLVVDGGSKDNTSQIAEEWGARVITSKPSRGVQMNVGASEASGDVFLFLHADTILPGNFSSLVRKVMLNPEIAGGSFAWKVYPGSPLFKFIEKTVNWRTRFFHLPYGDQAIFVKASLFRELGGYDDIPLMEDVNFIRRLRKHGKLAFIQVPVVTSPRRYETLGPMRTVLRNKIILLGYCLRVPPTRLARFYYKKK
jgi:rSAM/selenodomain-associated transferase 2/rSAM/selenodomain-associated transferase 1